MNNPKNHQRRRHSSADVASLSSKPNRNAAAPDEGPDYLVIGKIVAPRGVHGEMRVHIETEIPERFLILEHVYIGPGYECYAVRRARLFKGQALLQLEGIDDRDAAEAWRNTYVHVPIEEALPVGDDEYYHHEIVGLSVVTENGERVGRVTAILTTGANDVYVVRGRRGELLLPAIREVILDIDLDDRAITVRIPPGIS